MTIGDLKSRIWIPLTLLAVLGCGDVAVQRPVQDEGSEQELALEQAYQAFVNDFMQQSCDQIAPSQNEVHDCQRLVRPSRGPQPLLEFGPLIGILPDQDVLTLEARAYQGTPQPAALISNAGSLSGDDGYPLLGIAGPAEGDSTSTYCLWMQLDNQTWEAMIRPTPTPGGTDCGGPPDARAGTWDALTVVRQQYGDDGDISLYPNTARWQWTGAGDTPDRNGVHFIGVKCADGWCAVLPSGEQPPDMPQPGDAIPTRAIAGWHDAQFLGVMRPVQGQPGDSILVPGPWGTIYPEPVPPTNHPDWKSGIRVASFDLKPMPGAGFGRYATKVNARMNGRSWAVLSWQGDPAVGPQVQYHNFQGGDVADADGVITAPFPHGPAMSARWRWKETDETGWMPCPYYGCCDVEEGRF